MEIKSNGTVVLKGITPINARYGYSPKISDNGTWLVYNDIYGWVDTGITARGQKGTDGKDGKDGIPGRDGYTPIKGVDYFDGADGKDGAPGKDGVNGKDGQPGSNGKDGADGKTPVKGVDYFTTEDVRQIAEQAATMVVPYDDTALSVRVTSLETALTGLDELIGTGVIE